MNWGRLASPNHRGALVPRIVGPALAALGLAGTVAHAAFTSASEGPEWTATGAGLLVFAAGLIDELLPIGPRGIRAHLREAASGRMTTGALKVLVTVAAAVVVVAGLDRSGSWPRVGAVVLVAATTNVWNGLDVRPGRALKAFVLVAAPFAFARSALWITRSLWAGGLIALPWDLREKAMLGDSGSNLLGFVLGAQLAVTLPSWAMWPAAGIAVALNALAETITFTRAIDVVRPLRWFDRLGAPPR